MTKRLGGKPVTLKQIREYRRKKGLEVSRKEAIEMWYEKRRGEKKRFPTGFVQNPNHRKYLIQAFVTEFRKDNEKYPIDEDFAANKLSGVMNLHNHSPYYAFRFAGFVDPKSKYYDSALAETPWIVLKRLPWGYFSRKKRRVRAIKWLVKLEGGTENVSEESFDENGLGGLLQREQYDERPIFNALNEAYPDLTEYDLNQKPKGYWPIRQRRIKAIKMLALEISRIPIFDDYRAHGLSAIMDYYDNSPIAAAKDAGLAPKRKEMHFWEDENNFRRELQTEINVYGRFPKAHEIHDSNSSLSRAFYEFDRDIRDYRKEYEEKGSLLPI